MSSASSVSSPRSLVSSHERPAFIPPILLIHGLATRARAAFPDVKQTLTLVVDWSLAQIGLQRKWSEDARAIDDPLEQNRELIDRVLANEPPSLRKKVERLIAEVHARTERQAAQLAPVVQLNH